MKSPVLLKACRIWLLPALLILPGIYNLLLYGLPLTYDAIAHLWRIARMHDSIHNLIFFPRWIPDMLLGYGYPVLNYYASASYYLVEILALGGLGLHKGFIAVHCLLMWLAAVGMYLFANDTYGRRHPWAAYVASVAYAYGPYLMINFYIRSAIAEMGAQALLPWLFWSFQRIWRAENPKHYVVFAILTLGALAFTHTISLLVVPPFLIAYNIALALASSQRKSRLLYTAVAIAGAMGISCFFWGPLLLERGYVAYTAFAVAKELMLPAAMLTVAQLVNTRFFYNFSFTDPLTLGLIQSIGAVVGLALLIWQMKSIAALDATARNEWLFWIGASLLCVLLMLDISAPLWLSNDILPIIQFPWRLLMILQLPIALLTGFTVTLLRPRLLQAVAAAALMLLLIVVHLPNLDWDFRFDARTAQYHMGVNAYYDGIRGTIVEGLRGDLANQEFRPRWAGLSMRLDPATVPAQGDSARKVRMKAANSHHLQLAIESTSDAPLRLTGYYFPGWAVILDGREELEPYPSTNLGLLTVDLPAGEHTVDILWRGTTAQIWSGHLSLITLVLLCLALAWWRPLHGWLLVVAPLLILGIVATYLQPGSAPVQKVELPSSPPGLEFLGYSAPKLDGENIFLSTYWYVTQTQPSTIQTRLQLLTESGEVVQEITARPFYNGYSSQYWASNTIVDDGYWLPLPPGLAAGAYRLRMTLLDEESGDAYHSLDVGTVAVTRPTERFQPSRPLDIRFDQDVVLTGYDFGIVEPRWQRLQALTTRAEIPVVHTGQTLAYTLYWRTERPQNDPFIGFLHLLDRWDHPYVQQDQIPRPLVATYRDLDALWPLLRDSYQLPITETIPSGIYVTDVGMYDWRDEHRVDVTLPDVEGVFDHYELPPVKVVNLTVQPAGIKVDARFGEFAELLRFHVIGEQVDGKLAVRPGSTLTLTTYYEAKTSSPTSLTRFVQLRNAQNEILAQHDSEPQEGGNPAWAWLPGEIVVDVIPLTLPVNIPDEQYTLYLGWYDAAANLAHLPTYDHQGNRLANDEVPLLQLTVTQ